MESGHHLKRTQETFIFLKKVKREMQYRKYFKGVTL